VERERPERDFIVNEQGIVTLPLLGRVDVSSIPLGELRDRLIPQYAAQLRNPSVTITPVRRVYVMGEVVKPVFILWIRQSHLVVQSHSQADRIRPAICIACVSFAKEKFFSSGSMRAPHRDWKH
jgi:hypothetical protein